MKPDDPRELYEEDFVRWTEQQSSALREAAGAGVNLALDWENLAEEIDSLGRSQRRELRSRISVIIEHLLKLEYSSAHDPRRAWIDMIARERSDIELLIEDSPSLRGEAAQMVEGEIKRAIRNAARALVRHGEPAPERIAKLSAATYTEAQVLGDWFPRNPSLTSSP
jgi:hypothetical protein